MTSVPLHLLDDQTLVAALLRIQSMPKEEAPTKKPEVPAYTMRDMPFLSSFLTMNDSDEPRPSSHHELGKTIAAELWSRGVLRLELPTIERVMREADALLSEGMP